jgi:hypothetical protein
VIHQKEKVAKKASKQETRKGFLRDLREITLKLLFVAKLFKTGSACIKEAAAVLSCMSWKTHER